MKRWKQKAKRQREDWSSTEKVEDTSIFTALLGRLSKLSFMNFCQIALEMYMKTLLVIVHAMKLQCSTVCDTEPYCGLCARYVPCNGVKTIS